MCFIGKKIRINSSKMVEVSNSTVSSIFQVNASKPRRPLDTVDLEELPDSREGTRVPVLWLSCEGQTDVWEMFSDNSNLSASLDRQGLSVAVPVDLRTKKFRKLLHHSCCRAFGQSSKKRMTGSLFCPRR